MNDRFKNIQKFFRNFYKDSEFDFDLEKVEVSEFFNEHAITLWRTNEWHAQISCIEKTKEKVVFVISRRDRTWKNRDTKMYYYSFDEKGIIMEEKYKRNDINVRIIFFYDGKNRMINRKKYEYEDNVEKNNMMYVDDMKKVLWRELHIFYEENFNFRKLDVFDTIGIKKEENYMIFCHSKGHALIEEDELKKINFYINNF